MGEFVDDTKGEVHIFGGGMLGTQLLGTVEKLSAKLGLKNAVAWQRGDMGSKTTKTSMRGGPQWQQVRGRVTADANSGEILKVEEARYITRNTKHALVPDYPRDIVTVLLYEKPTYLNASGDKKSVNVQSGPKDQSRSGC